MRRNATNATGHARKSRCLGRWDFLRLSLLFHPRASAREALSDGDRWLRTALFGACFVPVLRFQRRSEDRRGSPSRRERATTAPPAKRPPDETSVGTIRRTASLHRAIPLAGLLSPGGRSFRETLRYENLPRMSTKESAMDTSRSETRSTSAAFLAPLRVKRIGIGEIHRGACDACRVQTLLSGIAPVGRRARIRDLCLLCLQSV